eukprot:5242225-Lingulodinium_polyedra.AAC.1
MATVVVQRRPRPCCATSLWKRAYEPPSHLQRFAHPTAGVVEKLLLHHAFHAATGMPRGAA